MSQTLKMSSPADVSRLIGVLNGVQRMSQDGQHNWTATYEKGDNGRKLVVEMTPRTSPQPAASQAVTAAARPASRPKAEKKKDDA